MLACWQERAIDFSSQRETSPNSRSSRDATEATTLSVDASEEPSVARLYAELDEKIDHLDLVHYNPSLRFSGPITELDPADVLQALKVSAYGGFLVAQQAAKRMTEQGHGAIFFTGASASVKGYARSAPFAMGKFALRGLAQSMARELHPQNIHIAHFVIDGGVKNVARGRVDDPEAPDRWLDPDAIAETYLHILNQPRSVWSWEVALRPWGRIVLNGPILSWIGLNGPVPHVLNSA